tara:strand:- start:1403 stop:2356 length:954 start_codon:yes stop_codon:yes gene_type:complete
MENANVQDTPQNANTQDTTDAFGAPQVDAGQDSSSELSVDDIILGNVDDTAPAFGTPTNESVETPSPTPADDARNDDTRYQYWQSQAAKLENELGQVKEAQAQQQLMMQQQILANQPPQESEPERFPDAPARPVKPRNYSREEAYNDPSSESARFLDEQEEWRDNMEEYRELKSQYDAAVMREQVENERNARVQEVQRQQAIAQQKQQINQVGNLVMNKYGLTKEEAGSFIQDMSSDESLTMDNLVQLWRMKTGQGAPQGAPVQNSPSPTFEQTKRAQQIPSPMGVMPGTGQEATTATEDQVMDAMIKDFNSKNPFK